MPKLRPRQMRRKAQKITPEVPRANPWQARIFRARAKQAREAIEEKKKWELDLD